MNSRININNNAPTHTEANRYLTDLMIDLKKMVLIEPDYQPFTMERLNEWSDKHIKDIQECWDYLKMAYMNLADEIIYEHADAVSFFNAVIIDLKLMVSGIEHGVFDEARIEMADHHWSDIVRCRKRRTIFY